LPLHLERHDEPDGIRLVAHGALDMSTGPELERELLRAEQAGAPAITLDLSPLDFFDSTGLALLLDADIRAAEAGRRLVVVPGDGEVERVLRLVQVTDRLTAAELR
jgi:anti-anti-sigma factor